MKGRRWKKMKKKGRNGTEEGKKGVLVKMEKGQKVNKLRCRNTNWRVV